MSWERGRYYTSSSRQDGKVHRTYWGKGEWGRLASQGFEAIRQERRKASQALKKQKGELIDVEDRVYCAHDMARLAFQGVLEAAGFHQHDRGEWRKRRTSKKGQLVSGEAEATDSKVTSQKSSDAADAAHDPATDDWEGLLTAATQGKSTYRLRRDKILSLAPDRPSIELAHQLLAANIDHLRELLSGDNLVQREILIVHLDQMRTELLNEGDSRLEGMIVETIVLCFLQLCHAKRWHRHWLATVPMTISLARFSHSRLGGCQRRYLATFRMLETVRQLARRSHPVGVSDCGESSDGQPTESPVNPPAARSTHTLQAGLSVIKLGKAESVFVAADMSSTKRQTEVGISATHTALVLLAVEWALGTTLSVSETLRVPKPP